MHTYRTILRPAFLAIAFSTFAFGQQEKPTRRLESITWNPVEHKLTWTVSKGAVNGGKFEGTEKLSYEIDMDAATMSASGEGRRFSENEAASVHSLMDLVAKYAAESTLWWESGQGQPIDGKGESKIHRKPHHRRESPNLDAPERQQRSDPPKVRVIRIAAK
jgi:hypothetical protein